MTQHVNLYQPEFREERPPLDPTLMARSVAGLAVALVVITAWIVATAWSERRAVADLEAELARTQTHVDALESNVARHLDAAGLEARVAGLQSELEAKQRLVRLLEERVAGSAAGFSSALQSLAHQRLEGLWLTGFEIAEGGDAVTLRGRAVRPELIPRYLQRLGEDRAFRDREFHSFALGRPEEGEGAIEFQISSLPEAGS